jgi:cobalt transporter subunit CbtB
MAMSAYNNPAAVHGDEASRARSRAQTLQAAVLAAIIGGVLLFATGFAHPQILHNGAHDTRHGLSFPCH